LAGFDFDRLMSRSSRNQQIDFIASLIAKEHQRRMDAFVLKMLERFGNDQVLVKRTAKGVII